MRRVMRQGTGRYRQQGLTLVELMVAMTLGLILTAGVLQLFASSKQTYRVEESLSRLQENSRFALDFITNDIRMAGYWGCQSTQSKVTNNLKPGTKFIDFSVALEGQDGGNGPDTLTLRGASAEGALRLLPNNGAGGFVEAFNADLMVAAPNGLRVDDIVMVNDCSGGDIFQISGGEPAAGTVQHAVTPGQAPGNSSVSLSRVYKGDASLFSARQVVYRVVNGALRRAVNGVDEELVSGVTNMKVFYGQDTNGDRSVDSYVARGQVGDMGNVISLRVELTLQADANTSMTAGQAISRTISTTVAMRNRVL